MRKAYGFIARQGVMRRIAVAALAVVLTMGMAPPMQLLGLVGGLEAYAAESGTTSEEHVNMERHWSGGQHNTKCLLKIDDKWVYCMQGGKSFKAGQQLSGKDAVESGKLSQKCVTDLALAYEYVWNRDLYTKPSGKKLSSNLERYAAAQVLIWHILLKYGEDDGPSHSSISIGGEDITGDVDESSNNKKALEWIADNRDDYIGYCTYFTASGAQNFALDFKVEQKFGAISLVKKSSAPSLSDSNGCYSLKGAVYGVFESKKAAQTHDASHAIKTYKTDASGSWESGQDFRAGTYYVAETSPSAGFLLDEGVYEVAVKSGKTAKVNGSPGVSEVPIDSPFEVMLAKWDADLKRAVRQGAASLAGAEFTVSFYAGNYAPSDLPKPTRSWVLRTDASGVIDFQNMAKYKVSGSDFYRNSSGKVTMPLGTVSVVETKAPVGYNLESADGGKPKTYVFHVVADSSSQSGASQKPANYSGNITQSNTPIISDVVKRGDYRLVKEVPTELSADAPQEQERVLLEGIQFQLINDNDAVVISPETGEEVDSGGVVCTITTDSNGLASTQAGKSVNGWALPSGWTGALAFGTYRVHEVIPDDVAAKFEEKYGAKLLPVEDWKVSIVEEGQFDGSVLVNDRIPQSPLKVVKVDAETGERIPAQASFQLFDAEGELVTYTARYPEKMKLDTWTSNERGELTLPMMLSGGTYTLQEVQAPEGYALSPDPVPFKIDEYRTWDDPIEVVVKDMPIKGVIELMKADEDTGSAVAGAQYAIAAADDIVTPDGTVRAKAGENVALITTDADGRAASPELYLGAYKVYETKSPVGYALDTYEHIVSIVSEGQDVPVVTVGADFEDAPTKLRIMKADIHTGAPLAHAKFRVWQDAGEAPDGGDAQDDAQGDQGGSESAADAGSEGVSQTPSDVADDGQGESADGGQGESADGGADGNGSHDGDGSHDGADGAGQEDAADPAGEGAEDPADAGKGAAVDFEIETDEDGIVELPYLEPGAYHVVELEAPEGYYVAQPVERYDFTVDDQGLIGLVGGPSSDTLELFIENTPCEIGTTATVDGFHRARVSRDVVLVDTVSYKGCKPGERYTVSGTLHKVAYDDAGEKVDGGAVSGADGKPLSVEVEFTAQAVEGSVEVTFRFDAESLEGCEVVAFEEMRHGQAQFAVHADITDEEQTVFFEPEIGTTLTDKATGNHTARVGKKVKLVDVVAYRGLKPGHDYTVRGVLVNASTGDPLRNAKGREITAEKKFTCTSANGSVNLVFKLDSSKLAGTSTVAYETVFEGDAIVAAHADLSDADQTVTFPSAKTSAVDGADKDKSVAPDGMAKVVDTVVFTGLTPGQKYVVTGTLHAVRKGKDGKRVDAGVLKDAHGKAVTATATFKPKKSSGSVDVVFEFDASKLDGAGAVAFETVAHARKKGKPVRIVEHADIQDADQFVSFEKDTPAKVVTRGVASALPKTGDDLFRFAGAAAAACLAALGAAVTVYVRRTRFLR